MPGTPVPRVRRAPARPRLRKGDRDAWRGCDSPCPDETLRPLATLLVALPRGRKGVLLDNCAGDGRAASHLARAWNCRAYLVEPNPHRARLCRQRRDAVVVRGRAEALAIRGTPSVWYFNPPFDPDDGSGRLERALFERSVRYAVGERTVGVLILPLRSLLTTDLMAQIVRRFETVRVRGLPAGVFKAYR